MGRGLKDSAFRDRVQKSVEQSSSAAVRRSSKRDSDVVIPPPTPAHSAGLGERRQHLSLAEDPQAREVPPERVSDAPTDPVEAPAAAVEDVSDGLAPVAAGPAGPAEAVSDAGSRTAETPARGNSAAAHAEERQQNEVLQDPALPASDDRTEPLPVADTDTFPGEYVHGLPVPIVGFDGRVDAKEPVRLSGFRAPDELHMTLGRLLRWERERTGERVPIERILDCALMLVPDDLDELERFVDSTPANLRKVAPGTKSRSTRTRHSQFQRLNAVRERCMEQNRRRIAIAAIWCAAIYHYERAYAEALTPSA